MSDPPRQLKIKNILSDCKTIAVIGLSREPEKDSYRVAEYLKKQKYHIVPVNPFIEEVLGEKSYKSLLDIPIEIQKEIDVVDIFRRPKDVPPVVKEAIELREKNGKPCVVWMQLGIINVKAASIARKAGLTVIMNKCIMQEHKRLLRKPKRCRRAPATR